MFPHLPRHYLLLEHPPREVGHLQTHEADHQLLGLLTLVLGPRLLLTLLGRIGLDGVIDRLPFAAAGPEDDELDDGVEERLAGRLHVVLLPHVPGGRILLVLLAYVFYCI